MSDPGAPGGVPADGDAKSGIRTQTLDRALQALQTMADGKARTSQELAAELGLHRSIVYRILRTFEDHNLVSRTEGGRYHLGLGLAALSQSAMGSLDAQVRDILQALANAASATALFCVPQAEDTVVLAVARPTTRQASIAVRAGSRIPLANGAPGLAILALSPEKDYERSEVTLARRTGLVRTHGEPYPGLTCIAVPVRLFDGQHSSLSVLFPPGEVDEHHAGREVTVFAGQLAQPPGFFEH